MQLESARVCTYQGFLRRENYERRIQSHFIYKIYLQNLKGVSETARAEWRKKEKKLFFITFKYNFLSIFMNSIFVWTLLIWGKRVKICEKSDSRYEKITKVVKERKIVNNRSSIRVSKQKHKLVFILCISLACERVLCVVVGWAQQQQEKGGKEKEWYKIF